MTNNETLGAALRALRERRGWSLQDLADRIGSTKMTISVVERGLRSVTSDLLFRWLDALGATVTIRGDDGHVVHGPAEGLDARLAELPEAQRNAVLAMMSGWRER